MVNTIPLLGHDALVKYMENIIIHCPVNPQITAVDGQSVWEFCYTYNTMHTWSLQNCSKTIWIYAFRATQDLAVSMLVINLLVSTQRRSLPRSWHSPAILTQSMSSSVIPSSGCLFRRLLTSFPAKWHVLKANSKPVWVLQTLLHSSRKNINIHTPPTKGIGNSRGVGWEGGLCPTPSPTPDKIKI